MVLRRRREADLDEELRFHLDREVARLVAAGVDPAAARLQARRLFGSLEIVKEESRDARGTTFVDHLTRDTRHAVLRLSRDWRFTLAAVVVLGLGIGVNTALFSLVNAVLFRQYSVADTERVVDIYQNLRGIRLLEPDEYTRFNTGFIVYHDDLGDYSTNEPIMDGTANLSYLFAAMVTADRRRRTLRTQD